MRVKASAPGKLILMGEHAAVYGRPVLVAALDLRTEVEAIVTGSDDAVTLDLVTLDHHEATSWREIRDYCMEKRAAWRRYAEQPAQGEFKQVVGDDPAHVVKVALGETWLRVAEGVTPPPVRLEVRSEIPAGAGLGSSASVAAAVIGALWELLRAECGVAVATPEEIGRIALDVERRQHGSPSGADHSAVLSGGVLRVEPDAEGGTVVSSLEMDGLGLRGFRVLDTGRPGETTGEVVAAVRRLRDRDREGFGRTLNRMEAATLEFERQLLWPPGDAGRGTVELSRPIGVYQRCLEAIGVVPEPVAAVVRRIEAAGAAAKISGAGSLSGSGAGALLVHDAAVEQPAWRRDLPDDYRVYAAELGAPGLRVQAGEEATP